MKFNATIDHQGALASYEIYREAPGIYSAELVHYDGDIAQNPPPQISLVRGIRQWAGSAEDEKILNSLGYIIESNLANLSASGFTKKMK